jgi:hypothetical protein
MRLSLKEGICLAGRLPRNDDVVMGRAGLLKAEDRDVLDAVVLRGQPVSSVARLMGVSPRVVRNRVLALSRRMGSRQFLDAARALPYLDAEDAAIAHATFCQGVPQRELCVKMGMTGHALRRRLDQISARIATIRLLKADSSGRNAETGA